jgi:ubiquitin C-terminal hydrolase
MNNKAMYGMNMNNMNNMNIVNNMNRMNMNSMNNINNNYNNMNNMGNMNNINVRMNNNMNNNINKMNMNSISFSNNRNVNNRFNQNLYMNNINNQNQLYNNNQFNNNNSQAQVQQQNNYQNYYNQFPNQVQNNIQINNNFNQNNINMNNTSDQQGVENNNNSNQNNNNEIVTNDNNGDEEDIDGKDDNEEIIDEDNNGDEEDIDDNDDNKEMIDEDNNYEKNKHIDNLYKKNNNAKTNNNNSVKITNIINNKFNAKNKNYNRNNANNNFNDIKNKHNIQKKSHIFNRIQDETSNKGVNFKYTNNRTNAKDTKIYNNTNLMNNQQKNNTNKTNNNVKKPKNNTGNANKDLANNKRKNMNNLNPKTIVTSRQEKINIDFYVRARGLDNVGATCYMNATLQCFYHVKALSEHLINNDKINRRLKLTFCYKDLVEELVGCKNRRTFNIDRNNYTSNDQIKDSIKPTKFKDLISEMNPLFKGVKANDSKDLILFLLETMNAELTQMNNHTDKMEPFYGDNKEDMEPEKFKKFHNSIISDIFYGFQKGIIKCDQCGDESVTYSIINLLVFPLEKIYTELNKGANNNNYNMNMNMNNYGQNNMNRFNNFNYGFNYSNQYNNFRNGMINNLNALNPSTIQPRQRGMIKKEKPKLTFDECFTDLNKAEILTGQNAIYCNKCKGMRNAKMFNEIIKAPNVLIIILNRGKGNTFECDVDFPSSLDLSKYIKEPSSIKQYELMGVISHLGRSSMEGHFIAYCRHFDFSWYLFNDSIVKQIGGVSDFKGIPYILFYQNK